MKILVTGGTGFLGSRVLRFLIAQGRPVKALRRASSRTDLVADILDQVEWVDADVTDIVALEDALEDVSAIIHCAAVVSFHPRDVQRMMNINVEGTANLVNLALDSGGKIKRFIHVSSIAALGRSGERTHLDESTRWVQSPLNTQYAISKYMSEQEVWRGHAEGLSVAIVNPSMILGSGYWDEGTAKFFKQIDEGLKFCPTGRSGFVDVADVARFMILLLDSNIDGERYVLNAENLSYRQFFDKIADAMNKKSPPIKVGPLLAETAWRVEWLKEKILGAEPLVTRESARSSVMQFTYGNEKSLNAFAGKFAYTPIDDAIRQIAAKYRADHSL